MWCLYVVMFVPKIVLMKLKWEKCVVAGRWKEGGEGSRMSRAKIRWPKPDAALQDLQ